MATYKKKDNNEKSKKPPAAEDDFFSVSSFAEFLKTVDSKKSGSVDLKADSEQVIEPLDVDAQAAIEPTVAKDGTTASAVKDESPAVGEPADMNAENTAQPQVSGDDFLKQLYSDAQSHISSELDALKNQCRLYVPEEDGGASASEGKSAPSKSGPKRTEPEARVDFADGDAKPAKATSFSAAVKAAMDAEGGYDGGFNVSLDALDEKPDFEQVGNAGGSVDPQHVNPAVKKTSAVPMVKPPVAKTSATQSFVQNKSKKKKGFFAGLLPGKKDGPLEIFRKSMFLVAVVTMVICLGILGNTYLLQPYLAESTADELSDLRDDAVTSWDDVSEKYDGITFPSDMRVNLAGFYAINSSFYGYLEIDGTTISMPIVHGTNNDYYLKRDFYKKWTKYGCPFVDYRNSKVGLDRNTIIYGHNMEYDDLIFGQLEIYRKIDGFKAAPLIKLETLYDEYAFKVYGVFVSSGVVDSTGWIFNYIFTELISDDEFAQYISEVDQRKLYTTGVDIKKTDKIVTLSTCAYDFNNAKLVVIGRLLRDGESATVDTSKAVANPNPRYPAEYYAKRGIANPYAKASKWIPNA